MLGKTLLEEIRRALTRTRERIAYANKERAIDPSIGDALDKLSEQELREKQKKERERLDKIAQKVLEITRLKKQLETTETQWLDRRDELQRLERQEAVEQGKVNEATRARQAGPTQADRNKIIEIQKKLQDKRNELAKLEQELKKMENLPTSLEAAEAEYNRVRSERIKLAKDLELVKERRAEAAKRLQVVRQRLNSLTQQGRAQGREAILLGNKGNTADCQKSLVAAENTFTEALALAKANQGCLDVSGISTLEKNLQTLRETARCGGASRQSGLLKVPAIKKGTSQATARSLLERMGFWNIEFVQVYAPSKPEEAGRVVGVSSPTPGKIVPPETRISVSIFNNPPPEEKGNVNSWDKEADNARVSAKTRTQPPPAVPIGVSAPPPTRSQVDQAKEVADQAAARGPQEKPWVNPVTIMDGLATAAGMAAAAKSDRDKTISSTQSPPLTPIPSNPLPGVIPSAKSDRDKTIGPTQSQKQTPIPSTGTTGGRVATSGSGTATSVDGGAKSCTVHYTGVEGDAYYVVEYPGSPVGFEIRKTWDPPKGDADRLQCGSVRGAAKRCIEDSFRQMGRPVPMVLGPFSDPGSARRTADSRCR